MKTPLAGTVPKPNFMLKAIYRSRIKSNLSSMYKLRWQLLVVSSWYSAVCRLETICLATLCFVTTTSAYFFISKEAITLLLNLPVHIASYNLQYFKIYRPRCRALPWVKTQWEPKYLVNSFDTGHESLRMKQLSLNHPI